MYPMYLEIIARNLSCTIRDWGAFNNYVDKMRGEGVKNVCFCLCSGYKNCPRRGEGVKKWQHSVHVVVECPLTLLIDYVNKNVITILQKNIKKLIKKHPFQRTCSYTVVIR